jgi:hypothetical protein
MNGPRRHPSVRQVGKIDRLGGTLASVGLVGVAGVLCLLLFGLAAPGTGHAASDRQPLEALAPRSAIAVSDIPTRTVFLPLATKSPRLANVWYAAYYDNANLDGTPVYTAEEKQVDYDWGDDSAPPGLPLNYFSIRWIGDWDFEYGTYTFFVYADDGLRLWLDGNPLIDSWQPGQRPHQSAPTIVPAGVHLLKLEYFERTGSAAISLGWRRTDLYPRWQGDYYNNAWVEDDWLYRQDDSSIEFDWGTDCPDYLSCDSFSIAWRATPVFEAGTYRFHIYADEGYQLLVGGTKVKEGGWFDAQPGGAQDVTYDMAVPSLQYRNIQFNFHDRGGPAEARLFIQKLGQPKWTAEYYDNETLSGTPVKTREEEVVFYDWGEGKPIAALPSADSFSVRWSGQRYFHSGFYHFGLFADDGVRLSIDGELLVNQWHYGRAEYHSLYTYLTAGYHDVKIEYFEHTGQAEIRFWWE